MNLNEIETLVDMACAARISEVTVGSKGRRITIRKGPRRRTSSETSPQANIAIQDMQTDPTTPSSLRDTDVEQGEQITAPMVGIFHAPDPPLSHGAMVETGQLVGIIESMRLMNDLRSEMSGVVETVLIEDGMAVEYGQPILRIRPISESVDSDTDT